MAESRKFSFNFPLGVLPVTAYADGTYEMPCMGCREPLLIGSDDHFNVLENGDGQAVAILCVACANKAQKRLRQ